MTVSFDYEGVVHHQLIPQSKTINRFYYIEVIEERDLHFGAVVNGRCTTTMLPLISRLLLLPQPLYTPDLIPTDFFYFSSSSPLSRDKNLIQWINYRGYQKTHFLHAFSSGTAIGRSVRLSRGIKLNELKWFSISIKKSVIGLFDQSSYTLAATDPDVEPDVSRILRATSTKSLNLIGFHAAPAVAIKLHNDYYGIKNLLRNRTRTALTLTFSPASPWTSITFTTSCDLQIFQFMATLLRWQGLIYLPVPR